MDNINAFVLEDRLRLISEGKVQEYHIMEYYRHLVRYKYGNNQGDSWT